MAVIELVEELVVAETPAKAAKTTARKTAKTDAVAALAGETDEDEAPAPKKKAKAAPAPVEDVADDDLDEDDLDESDEDDDEDEGDEVDDKAKG
jgi:hypothetical protein